MPRGELCLAATGSDSLRFASFSFSWLFALKKQSKDIKLGIILINSIKYAAGI